MNPNNSVARVRLERFLNKPNTDVGQLTTELSFKEENGKLHREWEDVISGIVEEAQLHFISKIGTTHEGVIILARTHIKVPVYAVALVNKSGQYALPVSVDEVAHMSDVPIKHAEKRGYISHGDEEHLVIECTACLTPNLFASREDSELVWTFASEIVNNGHIYGLSIHKAVKEIFLYNDRSLLYRDGVVVEAPAVMYQPSEHGRKGTVFYDYHPSVKRGRCLIYLGNVEWASSSVYEWMTVDSLVFVGNNCQTRVIVSDQRHVADLHTFHDLQ